MPTFILRDPKPSDFPEWKSLFDGYNAFYGRAGPTALAPAVTEMTWKRIHDPLEPVHALVAEEGGKLVGLTHYLYHRTTLAIAETCYLQDLFTVPEARGRGIAKALIEAVYERARAAGAARVYWQTHETNSTARRLYDRVAERSGFIVYRHQIQG
jgi:GNAT superfamily N-acetyltransferase